MRRAPGQRGAAGRYTFAPASAHTRLACNKSARRGADEGGSGGELFLSRALALAFGLSPPRKLRERGELTSGNEGEPRAERWIIHRRAGWILASGSEVIRGVSRAVEKATLVRRTREALLRWVGHLFENCGDRQRGVERRVVIFLRRVAYKADITRTLSSFLFQDRPETECFC